MSEQNKTTEQKQVSVIDQMRALPRAVRRQIAKQSGTKLLRGINEGLINPKKNKKGLLDIIKKYN